MKNIKSLIEETKQLETLEELESSADLLEFGIEKRYYNKLDIKDFYVTYFNTRVRILTKGVTNAIKTNYLLTKEILKRFKGETLDEAIKFVTSEIKRIDGVNNKYKERNKFA